MESKSGQVCEDLLALIGRTKAGLLALAGDLKMTPIQLVALYAVWKGKITMGRVAGVLNCDPSNVTGIIDRLVAQGLVVRQEDEHDRRARSLQLTAKGEETVLTIMKKMPTYVGCDRLSDQELEALHSAVVKLTA